MMQAGKYWVGDLCYVMGQDWDEVCSLTIVDHECKQGKFKLADGTEFALLNTAFGDGTYFDQFGKKYSVDAGLIGCIRSEDIKEIDVYSGKLGNEVEFERDFQVWSQNGTLHFGHIAIETGEDSERDYNEEDEDDEY